MMWEHGSNNYSDGLRSYFNPRKSAAFTRKSSSVGTEETAPYCDLIAKLQGESQPTESLHSPDVITSSLWTISQPYMEKYLGNSTAPLSNFQLIVLRTHIALRSGGFFPMAAASLLVSGIAICKGLHRIHFEKSHQNALLPELRCEAYRSHTAAKRHH